ncbi:chain length determinant protein EpsF [Leptothrix sp. BB-4]
MTFSQFLAILRARWLSALIVLALTVGGAVGASLLLPKTYTATAAVVLDVRSPDPIAGMVLGAMAMPAYMATQVDIIQSDRVAQRVVQTLRLSENPQIRADWIEATEGKGSFEAWAADLLKRKLDVKPSRESNVVNVAYSSGDPRFAATLANAFVKAYMDVSIGLRVSPARQYNEFFDARAKELRETLEQAQSRLTTFQKSSGILATDERFDIETQRLNELSSQLVALQALAAESGSRSAQARGNQSDQLQDVIANPVVAGLRADLSRQEARLQELNARLGDAHPQVVELRANIAELAAKLKAESRRVSGSVGVTNTITRAREAEIRASLEAQRARVLALKQQRDEASVLIKEVETAQRALDQVVARASQTSLESQNTQTNISVLTPASEPSDPSSPRLLLNTLLSVFVGTLLAVGFALLRELLDRRVRGPQDLVEALGLPVLGALPRPMRLQRPMVGGVPQASTLQLPPNVLASPDRKRIR